MPAIDLASGTDPATLITTAAGEHFWCDEIVVIPDTAGVFELLSGSESLTGEVNALAGAPYPFYNLRSRVVGDNLVLTRGTAMAIGGTYTFRVK